MPTFVGFPSICPNIQKGRVSKNRFVMVKLPENSALVRKSVALPAWMCFIVVRFSSCLGWSKIRRENLLTAEPLLLLCPLALGTKCEFDPDRAGRKASPVQGLFAPGS